MNIFLSGGTGGIGEALLRYLHGQLGHVVCFTYCQNEQAAQELAAECSEGRLHSVPMDLRDSDSVDAAAETALEMLGDIDVVINNAAVNAPKLLLQQSDREWSDILATNLTGSFYLSRAFLMPFLGQGHGRFIHMGSISATGLAGQAAYSAAKAGLEGLSASIAREYGGKGIRSNVLRLGLADIGMGRHHATDALKQKWIENSPNGRLMEMRDVNSAVDFLLDPRSDFINGSVVSVTGGIEQI